MRIDLVDMERITDRAKAALGALPHWRSELAARLIRASNLVDRVYVKVYAYYAKSREVAVLALASDAVLERLGELGYSNFEWYRPDTASKRPLVDWEQEAIRRTFPPSPASILIGGAGSGREAGNLAQMGYDVIAFDPIASFVEEMVSLKPDRGSIAAYRAKYEDLPMLTTMTPGQPSTSLDSMPVFDAAILGWSSFSHILSESERLRALGLIARAVDGPILLSFFSRADETGLSTSRLRAIRRRIPGRNQDPGMRFAIYLGAFRAFTEAEMRALVEEAGLVVEYARVENEYSPNAHMVLRRAAT